MTKSLSKKHDVVVVGDLFERTGANHRASAGTHFLVTEVRGDRARGITVENYRRTSVLIKNLRSRSGYVLRFQHSKGFLTRHFDIRFTDEERVSA